MFTRLLPALILLPLLAACGSRPDPRGEALFYGREPLVGRVASAAAPLPPAAARCANCHEKESAAAPGQIATPGAPRLDRAWLDTLRPRRTGPASRYNLAAFCNVLRVGIDPAEILISPIMPRYELSDDDCIALWRYVDSR